jgi:hypothetical protein
MNLLLLANSEAGQPRGDCPYSNNLDFCRGCAPVPALDLDDRRNSIHVIPIHESVATLL